MRGIYIVEDNLARQLDVVEEITEQSNYAQDYQDYTVQYPLNEPQTQELTVPKGLSKLEKVVMALLGLVLFSLLLMNVHTNLKLSTSSRKVQDLSSQIQTIESEIENLDQHIHELSRYDRIHEIAEKYGLELHEENIRNISPGE